MPAAERTAVDQAVRDRIGVDLATTFLLEAGAGTGKTSVLVERYVSCVLDAELGARDVRAVAAITFTEKAAGELRQRVREEFERRARDAEPAAEETQVIERALEGLDDAPIGTIHGFAGRLLRECPVEAGVDPAFEQLDALGSELERARLWEEWLAGLAAEEAGLRSERAWLTRLLRAGVRLDHVRELAAGAGGVFGERYDLDPVPGAPPEPDLAAALADLAAPAARLREHCSEGCTDHADRGFVAAMDLVAAVERLLAEPPADNDQLAGALFGLSAADSDAAPGGRRACWDGACGGKEQLQACYRSLTAAIFSLRDRYAGFVTGLAVAVADAFARWAGEVQTGLGRLDFTDLLGRLRDLLAADPVTRGILQDRYRYVLVDEFQDTDPLQAEIVFFLCEQEPVAGDWRRVILEPGKLFVVGDPKQSIYRFRRADISLYDEVRRLIRDQPAGSSAVEVISQNFRTTPDIVDWVNEVFDTIFETDREEGRQPGYQAVQAFRPPAAGPRVAVLLGREYDGRAGGDNATARRDEARAIAALVREMCDPEVAGWHVQDRRDGPAVAAGGGASAGSRSAGRPGAPAEPTRGPRWGDIALLFRTTTGLETYEQALREAGVPYRVDGGTTYFRRREVADVLLCLRAVDDPSDGPALYGALHSTLFGFSDDDLFLFWAAGGRFDLFADDQPPGHEAVAAALRTLRALHETRAEREPYEMAAALVRSAGATELAATTGSGAPQAMANLEKLVERARAFSAAGGGGLGAFLAWAAQAGDAAGEQESQVDDEGDVVRLLTIHKAKGLEFPIVVLAGGALASGGGGGDAVRPLVDRGRRRLLVKLKADLPGGEARDLEPRDYTELKEREKAMEASELRRLLYVAATRARDRFVVGCFGKLAKKDGGPTAGVMLAPAGDALPAAAAEPPAGDHRHGGLLVLAPREPAAAAAHDAAPDLTVLLDQRRVWLRDRAALLEQARRPARVTSPSGLEHVDEEVRGGGAGAPPGRAAALVLGSAVHEVMELCDLGDEAPIKHLADAVTAALGRPDLAPRAAALARACWRSQPVRAAAASPLVHRELPVGALLGATVVNGAIDLLYLDGGEWVIVDYKTDQAAEDSLLRARYTPQGAAYAVAVERATGRRVREVVFVAAAADGLAVRVAVDDDLREAVLQEVEAAVGEGRAISADELRPDEPRPDEPHPDELRPDTAG